MPHKVSITVCNGQAVDIELSGWLWASFSARGRTRHFAVDVTTTACLRHSPIPALCLTFFSIGMRIVQEANHSVRQVQNHECKCRRDRQHWINKRAHWRVCLLWRWAKRRDEVSTVRSQKC